MSRIHESLDQVIQQERLVFWYDPKREWRKEYDSYPSASVTKLELQNNEFGTKVRILSKEAMGTRFLIYSPSERPADSENWLLDLLMQGHEFKADRASLAVQSVGLPYEFLTLAEQHVNFFKDQRQTQSLKELLLKGDEEPQIRLKMMAILSKTEVEVDAILLDFLKRASFGDLFDPVQETLGSSNLLDYFWKEVGRVFGYLPQEPSIHDFAVTLFRTADPLDTTTALNDHTKPFLQRWKDSQAHRTSFEKWSRDLERELGITDRLAAGGRRIELGESDTFQCFDKYVLHSLCGEFEAGADGKKIREGIQKRRSSFWYGQYEHGYQVINQAVELRELLNSAELSIESIDSGIERYMASWWKIDRAYRKACFHLRKFAQVNLMERIEAWIEKSYVNNFLLPLGDRWSDRIRELENWSSGVIPSQQAFFKTHLQPYRERDQTVFVIISDALRYEAAMEFAERINSENRYTTESSALLASLPSYTQLGMASLLPGSEVRIHPEKKGEASVDGLSATGTDAREEILKKASQGRGRALQAEVFLDMNTKTEGRALMKDYDLIYIYHNTIDKTGDGVTTEAKTVEAVEQAFDELTQIVKKVINVNGSNILLTADHGFLFQQDQIDDGDLFPYPAAEEWIIQNRRYAIGRGIKESPQNKVFTAYQLGLPGEWECSFPLALGRYPVQGSGKRYVHGGVSLQEVIVPVIRISKKRADDTGRVGVEFINVPARVTTGQVALSIYQEKPVTTKLLPRTLRVGLYADDGTPLSEIKTVECDSKDEEGRNREKSIILVLSHAADGYNNQTVQVRLEETLPGTTQSVTYKSHPIRIQKPFTSDFDEH